MRPLRYSINVTLDGCCDHREILADEDLRRHVARRIAALCHPATHSMTGDTLHLDGGEEVVG